MPEYIDPPLVTEPDDLAQEAFGFLEDNIAGWLPAPGNLEVWLVESLAQLAAELMDVASAVPTSIFKYFGGSILGLPEHPAQAATGVTTWTALDNAGYTIEAGTLVGIAAAGDELIPFEVQTEAVIPPGATTVAEVIVVAVDPGKDANGLSTPPEVIDPLDWVASVALDETTGGGVDEETDDEYLDRLRELATLLAPRPILPDDFAVLARTVNGVGRSLAIDLHNADTDEDDVPRCVTVVVADEDGEPVGPAVRDEVDALLQAEREVNFLVFVVDPTYTDIDVAFTFSTYPTYDPADVGARAEAAVADYLSPAHFGEVPFGDQPAWLGDTKVRYLEVAEVLNRVEGLWYVGTLTLNGGSADVALTGVGPLPRAGTVTGTPIP
jgi:baseplate J-like protein